MTGALSRAPAGLAPWALFGGLLASAGLPIYIHAPKFYVDAYGVSLGTLGAVLFALRIIDVVQDPLLGWLSQRMCTHRGAMVAGAAGIMALAMMCLFAVQPPLSPILWFALTLAALFTAFSFLSITFYAEGVGKAASLGPTGHVRLAGWREAGALAGISLAAVAPVALASLTARPFAAFAVGFAALALVAVWAMRREWAAGPVMAGPASPGLRIVLRDPLCRRLLVLALINAAPVAVTSTLFLFFVESRLAAPGAEGPLLVLFFLSAAVSAPLWGRVAAAIGARQALLAAMVLAVLSFGLAMGLGTGDAPLFAVICLASGAALGADMTLLPAMFARRLAVIAPRGAAAVAFGLWSFVSKFTLAFAAVTLLPILQMQGFHAGAGNPSSALALLSMLYAGLPCALKCLAIVVLLATPIKET